MATVRIPTPLRSLCGGEAEVQANGSTVEEVLENLENGYPGFAERLYDGGGKLRRFVNVYIGEEDIRFGEGLASLVGDDDIISIVPAVAGG